RCGVARVWGRGACAGDARVARSSRLWASGVVFFFMRPLAPGSTLFPYTTLFRSVLVADPTADVGEVVPQCRGPGNPRTRHLVERSEEHTSELQSRFDLVCRLLLEKKKK